LFVGNASSQEQFNRLFVEQCARKHKQAMKNDDQTTSKERQQMMSETD
jgi:hypothetical protein